MQANDTGFDTGTQVQQVMTEQHRGGGCKLIFGWNHISHITGWYHIEYLSASHITYISRDFLELNHTSFTHRSKTSNWATGTGTDRGGKAMAVSRWLNCLSSWRWMNQHAQSQRSKLKSEENHLAIIYVDMICYGIGCVIEMCATNNWCKNAQQPRDPRCMQACKSRHALLL